MLINARLKLGTKFVLFTLLLLLPPILLALFFYQKNVDELIVGRIYQSLDDELNFVKRYIDQEQSHNLNTAAVIATDPGIRRAIHTNSSVGINSHLNRIAKVYPDLNYLILVDSSESIFAVNTINSDGKRMNSESILGKDIRGHPLFFGFDGKRSVISSPGLDPFLDDIGLAESHAQWFVAPVLVRGKAKGWLVLSFRWQQVLTVLLENILSDLDALGVPVLHNGITDSHGSLMAGSLQGESDAVQRSLSYPVGNKELKIVIQFDQEEALRPLSIQRQKLLAIFIPLFITIISCMYLLVKKLMLVPIAHLQTAVQHISEGDFLYQLGQTGHDEFGELATQFNSMGKQVENARVGLEEMVDKRTSQLTDANKHLEIAVEEANQAAKIKSEFLASMSHEIRTPMNGVLGMLSLVLRHKLSDKQAHYINLAKSSADSLLTLINDILDFSKIEAGMLELENIDFDLHKSFDDFVGPMAQLAQDKGLELILDITQITQTMVLGDPGRLRQVLTNLVGNAIKFTKTGEIVIKARLEEDEGNSYILHCSVTDSGMGIPADKIGGLFDHFTQVDTSTTREFGGTGLGLAIVKQLCSLMSGGVSVTSVYGEGSCFEFSVRFQHSQKISVKLPNVDLRRVRVLIVDDNSTNIEVLREQLGIWGALVTDADSGASALRILEDQRRQSPDEPFQLAILDMQLPGMDGATLGKTIRNDRHYEGIKLIIMTSFGARGDAQYFSDLGFSAYISKPVTMSDLFDALGVVLENGEAMNSAMPLVTRHHIQGLKRVSAHQHAHILLVEDNAINQQVVLGMLEDMEIEADVANNGLEAISALVQAPAAMAYQLILMDCQMPGMDGYEATVRIRRGASGDRNSDIPIIALTANAMKGDREKCLQAGMNDYLAKPINFDELKSKLDRWLESQKIDLAERRLGSSSTELQASSEANGPEDAKVDFPVWIREKALEQVRGREDRLAQLLGMFVRDMPERISKMEELFERGEFAKLADIAHAIKGVTGNLGAMQLFATSGEFEEAGRKSDMVGLRMLWPQFLQQYELLNSLFVQTLVELEDNIQGDTVMNHPHPRG